METLIIYIYIPHTCFCLPTRSDDSMQICARVIICMINFDLSRRIVSGVYSDNTLITLCGPWPSDKRGTLHIGRTLYDAGPSPSAHAVSFAPSVFPAAFVSSLHRGRRAVEQARPWCVFLLDTHPSTKNSPIGIRSAPAQFLGPSYRDGSISRCVFQLRLWEVRCR